MGWLRRYAMGWQAIIPDALARDAKRGKRMIKKISRMLPTVGKPDIKIARDLYLIGSMNSDLLDTSMNEISETMLENMPMEVSFNSLDWIDRQLTWLDVLHKIYRLEGYSSKEFLKYYKKQMDEIPELARIGVEDDRLLESIHGLHDRVRRINEKLEVMLYNVKRMSDGGIYAP